eukprot:scaffold104498_cov40-Prasinocladus_malaysianus.AAC.1
MDDGRQEKQKDDEMLKILKELDADTDKCTSNLVKMHAAIKVAQVQPWGNICTQVLHLAAEFLTGSASDCRMSILSDGIEA